MSNINISTGYTNNVVSSGTYAFGRSDSSNNLGNNVSGTIYYSSPIQLGPIDLWKKISGSTYNTVAVKPNGTLWTWGSNQYGQLGNSTQITSYSPIQVGSSTDWSDVCAGDYCAFALKTDGTLWSWGYSSSGTTTHTALGDVQQNLYTHTWVNTLGTDGNTSVTSTSVTPKVTVKGSNWGYNLFLKQDSSLWVCGLNNSYGELGTGDKVTRSLPVQVGTNWSQVYGDGYHTAAVKTDGTLWTWGDNFYGELGLGFNVTTYSSPVQVGALTNWKQVAIGYFTAAIKTDGTLWVWGINNYGQLGLNDTTNRSSPIQVGSLSNWSYVDIGWDSAWAIKTDGTLWAWGRNNLGQLGLGHTLNVSSPTQVGSLTNWRTVSGQNHVVAVKSDGTLWGWGDNANVDYGITPIDTPYSSPIQVGSLTDWRYAVTYDGGTLAIKTNGTLWGTGSNYFGIGGYGVGISLVSGFTQIGSDSDWVNVVGGYINTQVTKSNGKIYTAGYGYDSGTGILVNGYWPTPVSSPVQIGSLTNWAKLPDSPISSTMAAIKTDGTLWTWGNNGFGQVGVGAIPYYDYSSPVQVGSLTNWNTVAIGSSGFATKTDGTLWSWGYSGYYELGTGSSIRCSSPIQVGSNTDWNRVKYYDYMGVGFKNNGDVYIWGYGQVGRHGLGRENVPANLCISTPVQLGSFNRWRDVLVSGWTMQAIDMNGLRWVAGYNNYRGFGDNNEYTGFESRDRLTLLTKDKRVRWLDLWPISATADAFIGRTLNYVDVSTDLLVKEDLIDYYPTLDKRVVNTLDYVVGDNSQGQLGIGSTSNVSTMVQLGSSPARLKTVPGAVVNQYNIRYATGSNTNGQLGLYNTTNLTSFSNIDNNDNSWLAVMPNLSNSTCYGIKTNGTLWSWGDNTNGRLGIGSIGTKYSSPIQVGSLTTWSTQISVNTDAVFVLRASNSTSATLIGWGNNTDGQLGQPTTALSYSSPIQIGTINSWRSIAKGTGSSTMYAISTGGQLYAWGNNTYGQLGNKNTTSYSSPILIGTLTDWKVITRTLFSAAGIKNNGTLWTWGRNDKGQLGLGHNSNYSSPIQVGSLTNWKNISSGDNHIVALKTDGTLWVWGDNSVGQLALGNTVSYSSPVQVGSNTKWKDVLAANNSSVFTMDNLI